MKKPIVSVAALSLVLAGTAWADGSGAHSHPHTHPHTGHAEHAHAVDPNLQHSHGASGVGVSHAHEINGVMVQHTHATQPGSRSTIVYKWSDKIAAREARHYGRREVGAGFGPYTVAEWNARAAAGQPGLVPYQEPWPRRKWYHNR